MSVDVVDIKKSPSNYSIVSVVAYLAFGEGVQSVVILNVLLAESCLGSCLRIFRVIHFCILSILICEFRVPSVGLIGRHPTVSNHDSLEINVRIFAKVEFVGYVWHPVTSERLSGDVKSSSLKRLEVREVEEIHQKFVELIGDVSCVSW